jgi:hypothetical protein
MRRALPAHDHSGLRHLMRLCQRQTSLGNGLHTGLHPTLAIVHSFSDNPHRKSISADNTQRVATGTTYAVHLYVFWDYHTDVL